MQQKTNGNGEARLSRQDRIVLSILALNVLVIFVWSFALHFGTTAAKNTEKREKNVFYHAQIIHLPENRQKNEMVYTAIPLGRTKEDTNELVFPIEMNVSNPGQVETILSNEITKLEGITAMATSFSKATNAIGNALGDFGFAEAVTTTTSTTSTTTTTTTTSTTTIVETTALTEKIVEEQVTKAPTEQADDNEPAPTDVTTPEPAAQPAEPQPAYAAYVSYTEYLMICNVVGHEYGADWVDITEKALVAEVIMNRVHNSAFPSTVEQVLVAPYQFSGAQSWAVYYANQGQYSPWVTESVKNAVNYYFEHISDYQHGYLYFWGDGWRNHFS